MANGNLVFTKIWEDETIFELRISASNQYVSAYQDCYFDDEKLTQLSDFLIAYSLGKYDCDYFESGHKRGDCTPQFSLKLGADRTGHVTIEADLEIGDVTDRSHRCQMNVSCSLGELELLGRSLKTLAHNEIGASVSFVDNSY
ncbi:MAG: hypothetical protein MJ085_00325 [Clostridia bacterium]|nr:hypothetical protein [Clostridia bacterium]